MDAKGHKAAIEAAVAAAEADGYVLDISNPCAGCCSEYDVTLTKYEGNWPNFTTTDSVEVIL